MADPNPRASKKANVVDQIEPSGGLFYAYVHERNTYINRNIFVFATVTACDMWWNTLRSSKAGNLNKDWALQVEVANHPGLNIGIGPQMFVFSDCGENQPWQIYQHESMKPFQDQLIIDGYNNNHLPLIPVQRYDGYVLGDKYVTNVPGAMPKVGDERDPKEVEKEMEPGNELETVRYVEQRVDFPDTAQQEEMDKEMEMEKASEVEQA